MKQPTLNLTVPFEIPRKLGLIRQRKLLVHFSTAVVAALVVLLTAMALAMLIDYLATLYDSRWRFVLTFAALAAAAATAIGWIVVVSRQALSWGRVANDVDRQVPQLQERWTTITRLGATAPDPQIVHPAMLRQVAAEAARWASQVIPEQIVSLSLLLRALVGLTLITAILGVAVCINSHQTFILLKRFWRPGTAISATELVGVSEAMVVGRGEPLLLEATVQGAPVSRATLFLRAADQPERMVTVVATDREPVVFSHRIRSVDEPFAFRFRAGDGQTVWCDVDVADRPEIDKIQLVVTPPTYAKQPTAKFDKLPKKVSALENSQIELALRPTIPVESVELQFGEERIKLMADSEGWYRWQTTLTAGFSLTPLLTESHGLTNHIVPKCEFNAVADAAPAVKVVIPNDQVAVRPDDKVEITFSANDDIGIDSAELLVFDETNNIGDAPIATIPIPLGEQRGERVVQQSVTLDLQQFAAQDGAQISYEIRVREDRGETQTMAGNPSAPAAPGESAKTQPGNSAPEKPQDQQVAEQVAAQPPANKAAESNIVAESTSATTPAKAKPSSADSKPASERVAMNSSATLNGSTSPSTGTDGNSESSKSSVVTQTPGDNSAASNDSKDNAAMKSAAGEDTTAPRSASTSRQSLSPVKESQDKAPTESATNPADRQNPDDNIADNNPPAVAKSDAKTSGPQSPRKPTDENNNQQQTSSGNQAVANNPESSPSSPGSSPPPDSMERRSLDVAQSSSSQRMKLKVDQWAGSFAGQQRKKLEMAIAPDLEALDKQLAKAQTTARGILDDVASSGAWRSTHDHDTTSAQQATAEAQKIIDGLGNRTEGTPYAFVGLQVVDIGQAHVKPAQGGFWKALQSDGDDRVASLRDTFQHLTRARELLATLQGQYARTRHEFELSEAIEHAKKAYQVFIENSQSLLKMFEEDPARFRRKLVEFNLDDEYLKRLQEVLEMQRDLRAELARILGDDPRLLQRFMDSIRRRSQNLREQLANLSAKQAELNREVRAWTMVEAADRPRVAQLLLLRHASEATRISTAADELQSRYQTWLPLEQRSKDADMEAAGKSMQQVASSASELKAEADALITAGQPTKGADADSAKATPSTTDAGKAAVPTVDRDQSIAMMQTKAQDLYTQLKQLEVGLQQIAARDNGADNAAFATNRLLETRRMIADTSAWVRQLQEHKAGQYPRAAQIEQYRLAMETDSLAGKLSSIEQTLSGMMQRTDGGLPEPIANKARDFLATIDKEVTPNQLTAVYALGHDELPRAAERQKAASDGLAKAEKLYDETIKLAIEELDKLPVQDPIADLLDDPTLDELLAQLEQELPLEELLGIPQRPSNLRIIDDWMKGGGDNAIATGGGNPMSGQMRNLGQRAQKQLDKSYQKAIARALKESTARQKIETTQPTKLSNWNKLVSQLENEVQQGRDKAPPEQYRRAIEQYFAEISQAVAEQEKSAP